MNYELLRNLQEAEALSQELLLRLRRTQDQLPDMVGGELLKLYQQAAPQGDPNGAAAGFNPGAAPNANPNDGVVDADFEEVKD
jgi:hypothetical protein